MSHLSKPTVYDIEDSNIALLGSDLEKCVREHAGDKENAWVDAGRESGLQIWRIEKFGVVPWPKDRIGSFYDGDSYVVLHTYKKTPEDESLLYHLHFWLGENTTQDEAGTAAYKTVELDDHLEGKPVQFREVQGYESHQFLSYFPRFISLKGGVATGFHHISQHPPANTRKLYHVDLSHHAAMGEDHPARSHLTVREVSATAQSLVAGGVYVLDKGSHILQFNTKESAGQERFKAAEFVQSIVNVRQSHCDITVFDENDSSAGRFLHEFGEGVSLPLHSSPSMRPPYVQDREILSIGIFRLSDASGAVVLEKVLPPYSKACLSSDDVFLVDAASSSSRPTIYVWIGNAASLNERRLAVQYAQHYLYEKKRKAEPGLQVLVAIPIVKLQEGHETSDFLEAV
ncbi:actin regulatory protein [Gymnopilus junonius]|uniref:Actin regulatory protein n=1 Tax=Gymnopilus junonius TaxID=109634 RepID=A0A9P5TSF9_GYMJU|nr:actin regulatory protein [Gymnopilus junonius]